TLAAGGISMLLAEHAAGATFPHALLASTMQAATSAGPATAAVTTLAKGVLATMLLSKLKQMAAVGLLCAVALALGAGARQLWAEPNSDEPAGQADPPNPGNAATAQRTPQPAPATAKSERAPRVPLLDVWPVLQLATRYDSQG